MPLGIYKRTEQHNKNISKSLTGRYLSKEHIKKMSEIKKGQIPWNKGKHLSEEHRKKLSLNNGKPMLGKHHTEETKRKIADSHRGNKCAFWRGGVTPESQKRMDTFEWDIIRKRVYKRDNWTCRVCGKHCRSLEIQCHHILPYRISLDNSLENLITLCKSCHLKEEWKYYHKLKGQLEFNLI